MVSAAMATTENQASTALSQGSTLPTSEVIISQAAAPPPPPQQQQHHHEQQEQIKPLSEVAWPLWDLYMEVPHPHASRRVNNPPVILTSPSSLDPVLHELISSQDTQSRISRFAFPEFRDNSPVQTLPEQMELNRYDYYATKGFQHHSFSLTLKGGERIQGHVRRSLPLRLPQRVDVGRRGVRALVLLTRATGGDRLYAGMLKSMEVLLSIDSLEEEKKKNRIHHFLQICFRQHQYMITGYLQQPEEKRRPLILTAEGLEFMERKWLSVDTSRFLVPLSLLQKSHKFTSSPMLPLLRCLGVANALRLITALLSERRILLISSSATRLATCCRAALSVLACGLLQWQHFLVPVLPPHLLQHLQAPFPYFIGILRQHSNDLYHMPDLGEVLIIDLDQNELQTRNIPQHLVATRLPDILTIYTSHHHSAVSSAGHEIQFSHAGDALGQDLMEVIKSDKKALFGDAGVMAEQAAKVGKAVKQTFKKTFKTLKHHGKKFLQAMDENFSEEGTSETQAPLPVSEENKAITTEDEIYTEGCHNEMGEEEARIAFCTFFLCLFGDLKWYLARPTQSTMPPQFDRDLFLRSKCSLGDVEGTPLFPLIQNFCQSQMLEEFVMARVEEIRIRMPVTKDAPLFLVCANYIRQNNLDFRITSVRSVTRQLSQSNPSRLLSQANANARRMAMCLTSNKGYEGDHAKSTAQLVEYCHENSVLQDVMSVLWIRLRDMRGAQWRHGLLALQILRNLLYHGPVAAIAEAVDGVETIRKLKQYKDNMRQQVCLSIQQTASQVYNLLVDRSKLLSMRRFCASRRGELKAALPPLAKDRNMQLRLSFRAIHPYVSPQNNGHRHNKVAPANIPYQMASGYPAQPPPSPNKRSGLTRNPTAPIQQIGQGYPLSHNVTHQKPTPVHQQQRQVTPQQQQDGNSGDLLGFSMPPPPASTSVTAQQSMAAMRVHDPFAYSSQTNIVQLSHSQTSTTHFKPSLQQYPPTVSQPHQPNILQIPQQMQQQPQPPPQKFNVFPHLGTGQSAPTGTVKPPQPLGYPSQPTYPVGCPPQQMSMQQSNFFGPTSQQQPPSTPKPPGSQFDPFA